jgi:hypothetical protein
MFDTLRKAARAFRVASPADAELDYLNDAGDRIELEYRQRQIDRGMFRRNKQIGY